MCNLYSVTRGQEAMRRLFRVAQDSAGNLPGLPAVYRDMMAPVVRIARDGEHELRMIRWGFPPPPNLGMAPVMNVRNLKSPFWRCWLKSEWRCLVPVDMALVDRRPKGEIGEHQQFAFLTAAANDVVRQIHCQGHAGAFDDSGRMGHMAYGLAGRDGRAAISLAE